MRNRKLIIDNRISIPDKVTLFFLLFSLKIAFTSEVLSRTVFDYAILICAGLFVFFSFKDTKASGQAVSVIFPLFLLVILSALGLLQICTSFSISNIVALICIICLVYSCAFLTKKINITFAGFSYFLALAVSVIHTMNAENFENTLPGAMCFLTMSFSVMILTDAADRSRGNELLVFFLICACCVVTEYMSWKVHSRTAMLVMFIIILAYFFFTICKFTQRTYCWLFWLFVLAVAAFLVFYTNIASFSWFAKVNEMSLQKIGKKIDSGRPELWKSAFDSMKPWQFIFGKGTGALPEMERYIGSSFHNSFIQLFVQLGIIGLGSFLAALFSLWRIISSHPEDVTCRLVLACFVGIIVYNCFECTLLQNKTFLGMIQWLLISLGIVRSRMLGVAITHER